MPAEQDRPWQKLGVLAALAGVLVAIAAVFISHRERVYVSITPVGWELLGQPNSSSDALARYNITVTGKAAAQNVQLKESCWVGYAIHSRAKPSRDDRLLANSLPPGTTAGTCLANATKEEASIYMMVKGVVTYEDEFGSHPMGFCFAGINIAGDKLTRFQDCPL